MISNFQKMQFPPNDESLQPVTVGVEKAIAVVLCKIAVHFRGGLGYVSRWDLSLRAEVPGN